MTALYRRVPLDLLLDAFVAVGFIHPSIIARQAPAIRCSEALSTLVDVEPIHRNAVVELVWGIHRGFSELEARVAIEDLAVLVAVARELLNERCRLLEALRG